MSEYIVTSTADSGAGTLREAIGLANADPGSTIRFAGAAAGATITIGAGGPLPAISSDLIIDGAVTDIDGNVIARTTISGGGGTRVFVVLDGDVAFENLILAGGTATGGAGAAGGGGGMGAGAAIFVNAGATTVANVSFSNNLAIGGAGGDAPSGAGGGGGGLGGAGGSPGDAAGGGGGYGGGGGGGGSTAIGGAGGTGPSGAGGAGGVTNADGTAGLNGGGDGGASTALAGGGGGGGGLGGGTGGDAMLADAGGGGGGGGLTATSGGAGGDGLGVGGNATAPGGGGGGAGDFSAAPGGNGGTGADFGGGGGATSGTGGDGGFGGGGGGSASTGGTGGFGGGGGGGDNAAPGGTGGGIAGSGGGGGAALGGAVFVRNGASLTIANGAFTGSGVTAGTGGGGGGDGAQVGSDLFLMSGTTTIFSPGDGKTLVFNGTIADDSAASLPGSPSYTAGSGAGAAITINGDGKVIFTAGHAYTYSGATKVDGGILQVDGTLTSSAITVETLGTLDGVGTVGAVSVLSGGTLAPGASAGVIHTGNLAFTAGATFKVEIGGTTAGVGGYDQAAVTGNVDLGNATLAGSLINAFNPTNGTSFTIIHDIGGSVTGTFAGIAEGGLLGFGGHAFQVSYQGGGGSDVVLTAVPAPPLTLTGLGPSVTFLENTVNASGQIIDNDVVFTDLVGNFDGGTLNVTGALPEDFVSIRNQGGNPGEIGFDGDTQIVSFGGTPIGAASGGSGGTLTVTFNADATSAAVDAVIENLTYFNASDTPTPSRTLDVTVTDATLASTGPVPITINVTPENEAPVMTVDPSAAYTEDAPSPTVVAPNLTLFDFDGSTFVSATISITVGFQDGDVLNFPDFPVPASLGASYDPATGILTIDALDTTADYLNVLNGITFSSTSDNPTNFGANPTRTISWVITDSGTPNTSSAPVTTEIAVTGLNEAPVLSNVDPAASYLVGSTGTTLSPGLAATDADSLDLIGATVKITAGLLAGDQLAVNLAADGGGHFQLDDGFGNLTATTISVASNAGGVLTLQGVDTPSHYQAVLDAVRYSSSQPDPTNAGANLTRTIEWQVRDDAGTSDVSTPATTVLNFTFAPTLDLDLSSAGNNFATSFTENGAAVAIADTDVTISDPDTSEMSSATVVLTNAQAADSLTLGTLPPEIDGSVDTATPGQITVVLGGAASPALYQAALRQVFFSNSSENPSTTPRDIAITINDGESDSNTAHTTVTVVAVNDPPVAAVAPESASGNEDTAINGTLLAGSDLDGDPLTYQLVAGSAQHGAVTIDPTTRAFAFTPAANYNGPASFQYVANDGTINSAPKTVSITVNPVNDAPTATFDSAAFTDTGASNADRITNDNTVTFAGTAADDVAVASVQVFNGATSLGFATLNAGAWSLSATLADGLYNQLRAVATDANASTATADFPNAFTIDTTAPAPPVIDRLAVTGATETVSGDAEANATVALTGDAAALGSVMADAQGHWSFNGAGLSAGTHSFTATATDIAGNASGPSAAFDAPVLAGHRSDYFVQTTLGSDHLLHTRVTNAVNSAELPSVFTGAEALQFSDHAFINAGADLNRDANFDGSRFDGVLVQHATSGQLSFASMHAGALAGFGLAVSNLAGLVVGGNGDVNANGFADVFVQNPVNGALFVATQTGTNSPGWIAAGNLTADWKLVGAADLNRDGFADAVAQQQSTGTLVYADMANGAFHGWLPITAGLTPDWKAVGLGDVSGDGFADVVVQNGAGDILYADMAGGVLSGWGVVAHTPGWSVEAVTDLTGDGNADVVIRHQSGGPQYQELLYADMHDGSFAGFGRATTGLNADWQVKAVADVDNDGFNDLIAQQQSTGIIDYAAQSPAGFNHWGTVSTTLGTDWHVV